MMGKAEGAGFDKRSRFLVGDLTIVEKKPPYLSVRLQQVYRIKITKLTGA
ncbi:MAG: hypothetical protein KME13_00695 [Myxacorys californica WJT36-NPBG1]|jgi:hypothetical protein|nr:hypothetical protein [Myxacorys californica WJT36-NPBG1]